MPRKIQFIGTKISNLSVSLRHVDTRTARRASLRISPSLEHPQASGSTTALEEWENEMVPLIGSRCVYDPEVLIVMTNAFDRACDFLPAEFRDSDHMRRKLQGLVSSSRHSEPAERCPAEHVIALIRGEYRKDTLVGVV